MSFVVVKNCGFGARETEMARFDTEAAAWKWVALNYGKSQVKRMNIDIVLG